MGGCCSKHNVLHGTVAVLPKDCSHGCDSPRGVHLKPEMLGVETPSVPGDVSLAGTLSSADMVQLAKRYKSWLYLNPKGISPHFASGPRIANRAVGFPTEAIQRAGCQLKVLDFFRPPVPANQTQQMLEAMSSLPRPLMVQCTTGTRSSALLVLWLAKRAGHNLEAALRVAEDMKYLQRLMNSGWVRNWLLPELQGSPLCLPSVGCLLEQFFEPQSCSFSYLLACKATKEAVLIDPLLNRTEADLTLLDEAGLCLKYALQTHCHYDHVSMTGSDMIKKLRADVLLLCSAASGAKGDQFLSQGDMVHFGKYSLEVRETPGHTPGCLSFVLRGDAAKAVFTGDALLVRGCGRTDFPGGQGSGGEA
ncbi:unnamed protein product [Effrenium voratum]|uniref:Metallo-beta-lactamase domain-containing protein n=1 Tax=Effrenium voratum TaxID=2562239 RepID=A0AA36IUP2_9DINO|nr:unnamed protein product [Effrenium voratum]